MFIWFNLELVSNLINKPANILEESFVPKKKKNFGPLVSRVCAVPKEGVFPC